MARFVMIAMFAVLMFAGCKLVVDDGKNSRTVVVFRVSTDEISNWIEASGGYTEYDASNLEALINGQAPDYTDYGLIEGIKQNLSRTGGGALEAFIMDFGQSENAQTVFGNRIALVSDKQDITGFSADVAQIDASPLGGCTALACFGQYYFWLKFTGYTDKNEAKSNAAFFLEHYKSKAEKIQ